jgi:hypothetical protein
VLGDLTCAVCGRPVAPRGASGGYGHRSRGVVAACDLDADHAALPDWQAAGELDCGFCGGRLTVTADNLLVHADSERDGEHAPQP